MNDQVSSSDPAQQAEADAHVRLVDPAAERPSLFCSLDGVCVNPHDAIPLDARDAFAKNFMRHFAAALGESQHAA
jgi:hypothetical protein